MEAWQRPFSGIGWLKKGIFTPLKRSMRSLMLKETLILIQKEAALEWRRLFALAGVLLFLVSAVFVSYLAFDGWIQASTWNALFWIMLLFASVNAVLKGFFQEGSGRMLYYYFLCSPQAVIFSKMLYNGLVMCCLGLAGLVVYVFLLGNPVESMGIFVLNMLLGAFGFSSIMNMASAMAVKAGQGFTLMAVLSFPLVLPLLLVLIRVSMQAVLGTSLSEQWPPMLVILLLTGMGVMLSAVLFPHVWRD